MLVLIDFLLTGLVAIFFHSLLSAPLRFSIQGGTYCPDFYIKFAIVLTKGVSSSVKYVVAVPSRPALPVLPTL